MGPPSAGGILYAKRYLYQARVARIGQETRNIKDGSLEVRTRLHQARMRATAMGPHFTGSGAPHSHDAPKKKEGFLRVLRGSMPLRAP